jgi:amino acid adenylation domain-containing protein
VGSPVAGRARREVEDLIGFFVNTLVLRTELDGDPSFREVLRRVRDTTLGAWEHQDVPFEKLVAELQPGRSLSHAPLFQVLFSLQNAAPPAGVLPGLSMRAVSAETGTSQYDLGLSLTAQAGGARGALTYSTDLFDRATAERMVRHLVRVLEQAAADAETRLADLRLVDDDERRVLETWSGTGSGYAPRPIHHLVAEQAARAPDAVALAFPGGTLTYGEMDRAANRLAHHLAARGAGPEALVGIVAERTPETAVAMLAVLKAGAAYLPLDPAYPAERLRYMLQDSGTRLVVAAGALPADADGGLAETVDLRAEADAIAARPDHAPRAAADAANLAYVIYTSGSTGRPKGVAVTHAGVPNLAAWKGARLGQRAGDRALQFASFSFDAAVEELFGALLTGSTLVMAPRDALMPGDALRQTLVRERITFATLPPSVLALMDPAELPELRVVVSAGEALPPAVAARWAGAVELHDAYGPTEATVAATSGRVPAEGSVPSIGRPLENVRAYVLDERMRPVPAGIPGELCVGGAGLARGYLNRAALTAERFVPDPFAPEAGARLYRTGDRARWRADGTLEYGGRLDEQVKVRGFRIELGEIEAALRGHAGVRDCVVVARGGAGDRRLVAYVVGDAEPDALRAHLRASLPEYMVPGPVVRLDALPVTPNGKLDRRALPAPADVAGAGRRLKPETELEARIALVCQELLEVGEVGVEDNFFDLGGHSLLLVRLQARLKSDLGRDVPLVDLFQYPTVRSLAAHLQGGPADTGAAAEGEERGGARQAAVSRRLEARRRRDG